VSGAGRVDADFVHRYRRRDHIPYLPPPAWVSTAPTLAADREVALFALDEMGKDNYLPIVCAADHPPAELPALIAPLLTGPVPGLRELRLLGDDPVLRKALGTLGFAVERTQQGMLLPLTGTGAGAGAGAGSTVRAPDLPVLSGARVGDAELAEHHNICFRLRLTARHMARMRANADWSDDNLFACRDAGGRLVATLRLVVDTLADGTAYGLLRGLAVRPEYRRMSLSLMTGLYGAARRRALQVGAVHCHLLVDRSTPDGGPIKAMYGYLGFRPETVMFRMRQLHQGDL